MNIVFLCTSSLDYPSPRGRWLPIAHELAKRGHAAHLLLLHPTFDDLGDRRLECDGVHVEYVSQMHVHGLPGQRRHYSLPQLVLVSWRASMALAQRARALRPDVIHIGKPQPINGLAGIIAARGTAQLYVDCDDFEADANHFSGRGQRALVRWWEDHLPRRARAVSVNTRFLYERNASLGIGRTRLRYVPNGLRAGQFERPAPDALQALRQTLGIDARPVVVYLGTLSTIAHGTALLLDAFALVVKERPEALLLMVGDGDERSTLQRQAERLGISAQVRWIGNIPHDQVRQHLSLADCSVEPVNDSPAARARSPMKIVESLALGVPVVSGDVGDRREMLADGAAGILVRAGDASALARGLIGALDPQRASRQMACAAVDHAQSYRWDRLIGDWLPLYGA